jgi:hypothetical protein
MRVLATDQHVHQGALTTEQLKSCDSEHKGSTATLVLNMTTRTKTRDKPAHLPDAIRKHMNLEMKGEGKEISVRISK